MRFNRDFLAVALDSATPPKVVTDERNRGLIKQPRPRPAPAPSREASPVIKPSITRYDEGVIFD